MTVRFPTADCRTPASHISPCDGLESRLSRPAAANRARKEASLAIPKYHQGDGHRQSRVDAPVPHPRGRRSNKETQVASPDHDPTQSVGFAADAGDK